MYGSLDRWVGHVWPVWCGVRINSLTGNVYKNSISGMAKRRKVPNMVCAECFEVFRNPPSQKYIRCSRCRVGKKGLRAGRYAGKLGLRIPNRCSGLKRCPLCMRKKHKTSKVCKNCWTKIRKLFAIARINGGRKEFAYGKGGATARWYARKAQAAGVNVYDGEKLTGGLNVDRLRVSRRAELDITGG